MFFNWLEYLVDPLKRSDVQQPPTDNGAFFGFFLWPMRRLILVILLLTGTAAISEIYLYRKFTCTLFWAILSTGWPLRSPIHFLRRIQRSYW